MAYVVISKPVPNFAKGRSGYKPEGVVIHIGEGSQSSIYNTFLTEQKSSNYCVSKTGEVWQFVSESDTAWAQGTVLNPTAVLVTQVHPNINPNLYLISIEHEGFGTADFTDAQYTTTSQLVADICTRWNIPIDAVHIIRHDSIRSDKTCPGIMNINKLIFMAGGITPSPVNKDNIKQQIRDLLEKL